MSLGHPVFPRRLLLSALALTRALGCEAERVDDAPDVGAVEQEITPTACTVEGWERLVGVVGISSP